MCLLFVFLLNFTIAIIIEAEVNCFMKDKFIVTPKSERSVTMTIRINKELNDELEKLALKSNRSRNELINMSLRYALNNIEFIEDVDGKV